MYPPILESQRPSIPHNAPGGGVPVQIRMQLPRTLDINRLVGNGTADNPGGHVQLLIRRQLTLESLATHHLNFSPDRETIYLPPSVLLGDHGEIIRPGDTFANLNILSTYLQPGGFLAGDEDESNEGQTYTIQVRFGKNPLWNLAMPTEFHSWRRTQVANAAFGEWSNTQRVFVYEGTQAQIFPTPEIFPNIRAGFSWRYSPISIDPLAQARLIIFYETPDGKVFRLSKNLSFRSETGESGGRWGAAGEVELDIARLVPIHCVLTLITVNNTIFPVDIVVEPISIPHGSFGFINFQQPLGDENEDGVIIMSFERAASIPDSILNNFANTVRSFRIELATFNIIQTGVHDNTEGFIRDYTVEMGTHYAYIVIGYDPDGRIGCSFGNLIPLFPATWNPQAYTGIARNLNFNGISFFTTRLNQLRLQGNVTVRNFNRVVTDQVTQTIGGEYPFVSRTGRSRHRTMAVSALISINFDPTRTFLNLTTADRPKWWDGDLKIRHRHGSEEVILRSEDIFPVGLFSNNTRRTINDRGEAELVRTPTPERNFRDEPSSFPGTPGPLTMFNPNFRQDITPVNALSDASELIYSERKFREEVMEWLTNGQPKLFRSETEGNMIVAITGVSFSPHDTSRQVYSFSATLTEIAEHNLRNLILYDLIPTNFVGTFLEDQEFLKDMVNNPMSVNQKEFRFFDSGVRDDGVWMIEYRRNRLPSEIPSPPNPEIPNHIQIGSQIVLNGIPPRIPEDPVWPGTGDRVFYGWFTDRVAGTLFDFSNPILEDTAIYARWVEIRPPVTG